MDIRKVISAFLLVAVAGFAGCIVRPKADTIIKLRGTESAGAEKAIGVRDVIFAKIDGKLEIVGRGFHPREHETYAFVGSEGFPDSMPRWIRITQDGSGENGYVLELWVSKEMGGFNHYRGRFECTAKPFAGRWKLGLSNIVMSPITPAEAAEIRVSGHVTAKAVPEEKVREKLNELRNETAGAQEKPG